MADILHKVPQYYTQVDSKTSHGSRMCRSSTNAMAIKAINPGALLGSNADDDYLKAVLRYGDTTEATPHVKAAAEFGVRLTNRTDGTLESLLEALRKGPVGVGWLHHGRPSAPRGGGHHTLLIGATDTHVIMHDPYGEADLVNGGYAKIGSGGKDVLYSWKNWLPRWCGPVIGPGWYTTYDLIEAPDVSDVPLSDSPLPISKATLAHIWGCKQDLILDSEIEELNQCLDDWDITTRPRVRHFLAQTAHESGGGRWKEELSNGQYLEGRTDIGNTQLGDGPRFKGAGYIQLTGRADYQAFSKAIGDPDVMEGCAYVAKHYPFTAAGWFWHKNGLNEKADKGVTVATITKVVNGGLNGLKDRERYYRKTLDVI
jgi:predicted chitinase